MCSSYKQLRISLANKDEQLALKDEKIVSLESQVASMKGGGSVFRARTADEASTPKLLPTAKLTSVTSTPNQVSDDSHDTEEQSSLLSNSLSHISRIHSSSDNEDSPTERAAATNGRWNIPFDSSFDDDLVPKSPSGGHETALREIGFTPIGEEDGGGVKLHREILPVKPVARKSYLKDAGKGKENVEPRASHRRSKSSPPLGIGTYLP